MHPSYNMIRTYELTLLARADVSDEDIKMAMQVIKDNILSNNGVVVYGEYWGLRQLEYPINKNESAQFYMLQFTAGSEVIDILNEKLKNSEIFIRYMIISINKDDVKIKSSNSNINKDDDDVVFDRRFGNVIEDVFKLRSYGK